MSTYKYVSLKIKGSVSYFEIVSITLQNCANKKLFFYVANRRTGDSKCDQKKSDNTAKNQNIVDSMPIKSS